MKTTAPLTIEPERRHKLASMLLAMLGLYWLVLVLTDFRSRTNIDFDIDLLLFFSCAYLLMLSSGAGNTLAQAAQILGQRRAPAALWHEWSKLAMRAPTRAWAMLCAALTIAALSPASTCHWPAAAALLSFTLSIGTVNSLARRGLLPRAFYIAIDVGILLLVLAITLLTTPVAALDRFGALPTWLLLTFAASWPLLSAWLMRVWRGEPQRYRWPGHSIQRRKPVMALVKHLQRYSPLRWDRNCNATANGMAAAKKGTVAQVFSGMPMIYLSLLMWAPALWNQTLSPAHLLSVGFLCLFMSATLVVRDLHWRMLLAPGGLHRGRIGLHILVSTLEIHLGWVAIVAAIGLAVIAMTGHSVQAMLNQYLQHLAIIPEIVFAASVGLLIRALPKAAWIGGFIFLALCLLAAAFRLQLVIALLQGRLSEVGHMTTGPAYVGILALTSIVSVVLANGIWTPKKLFPFGA